MNPIEHLNIKLDLSHVTPDDRAMAIFQSLHQLSVDLMCDKETLRGQQTSVPLSYYGKPVGTATLGVVAPEPEATAEAPTSIFSLHPATKIAEVFEAFDSDWRYCRENYTNGRDDLLIIRHFIIEIVDGSDNGNNDVLASYVGDCGDNVMGRDLADNISEEGLVELIEDDSNWEDQIHDNTFTGVEHVHARVSWSIKALCLNHDRGCEGYWTNQNHVDLDLIVNK